MNKDQAVLEKKAAAIRLLVLDVDGVLTNGQLHFDPDGREFKVFHVWDGYGIKRAQESNIEIAVISGRHSRAVETRMAELGIEYLRLGRDDKLAALNEITKQLDIPLDAVACVGDDIPDLQIMTKAGLSVAVADAHPDVIAIADWCTDLPGGHGAVREVCDLLVATQASGSPPEPRND